MPIKPDRPSGWTGLELPNSPTIWKKMLEHFVAAVNMGRENVTWQIRITLLFPVNCICLDGAWGFCFYSLLVMAAYFGIFLLPMERRHSHSLNPMVTFPLSSVRAALANRQYFDHFTQHGFNSSSAVPLGALWTYYWYGKYHNMVNVPLMGFFAKRLWSFFFF